MIIWGPRPSSTASSSAAGSSSSTAHHTGNTPISRTSRLPTETPRWRTKPRFPNRPKPENAITAGPRHRENWSLFRPRSTWCPPKEVRSRCRSDVRNTLAPLLLSVSSCTTAGRHVASRATHSYETNSSNFPKVGNVGVRSSWAGPPIATTE